MAALAAATLAAAGRTAGPAPIKIFMTTPIVSAQNNYPEVTWVGKFYEKWLNARGGINGRPLQIVTCDNKNEANATSACARKAVSEHVVAAVGSWTPLGDKMIPILEQAHIAWLGGCCPASTPEYTSPVSFPAGTIIGTPGGAAIMGKLCKRPAIVTIEFPFAGFLESLVKKGLAGQGITNAKFLRINATPGDYSPVVAQAIDGTDCIQGIMAEGHWFAWLPAMKQAGGKQRLFGPQGNLNPKVAATFPDVTQNAIVTGVYPSLDDPTLKLYRELYEASKPPKSHDRSGLGAVGAWVGLRMFTHVAEKMKGPITNETVLAALNRTTATDADGIIPPLDFTKPWNVKGYPRTFNHWMTVSEIRNGKFHRFGKVKFIDVLPAWFGKPIKY